VVHGTRARLNQAGGLYTYNSFCLKDLF
jgi:hypothetical protein